MKNYEKPVVLANNEMSEGVYAASGSTCWVLVEDRKEAGTKPDSVCFYVKAHHNTSEGHGYEPICLTIVFNTSVSVLGCTNGTYEVNGNIVKITSTGGLVANQNEYWEPSIEVAGPDNTDPNAVAIISKSLSLA